MESKRPEISIKDLSGRGKFIVTDEWRDNPVIMVPDNGLIRRLLIRCGLARFKTKEVNVLDLFRAQG